jgi:transglutaminase-like putative cysteine protease
MHRHIIVCLIAVAVLLWCCTKTAPETSQRSARVEPDSSSGSGSTVVLESPVPKLRTLIFTYEATVPEIEPGTEALQVWIPAPQNTPPLQEILDEKLEVKDAPGAVITSHSASAGPNRWWHVLVPSPKPPVVISAVFTVRRREQINNYFRGAGQEELPAGGRDSFREELGAYELVPTGGRIEGLARSLAPSEKNPVNIARKIYDHVLDHMRYGKEGSGWGRGDSLWACDSGYGNCTDFHSLFMSLAKARGIPARFHMGFPVPETRGEGKIGGYHCWAEIYNQGMGWIPVDISEADKHPELAQYYFGALTEDRVSFMTGRDLMLEPPPAAGKRNIFIYPHAEADGREIKVDRAFAYRDL